VPTTIVDEDGDPRTFGVNGTEDIGVNGIENSRTLGIEIEEDDWTEGDDTTSLFRAA
jgi:hypothetical protein